MKSKKCGDCIHGFYTGTDEWGCQYILDTGEHRPCPAGDRCTVRQTEKQRRAKALRVSQKAKNSKGGKAGRPRKWTPEKDAELERLTAAGFSAQEIGDRLGVTADAVRQRRHDRKKEGNHVK